MAASAAVAGFSMAGSNSMERARRERKMKEERLARLRKELTLSQEREARYIGDMVERYTGSKASDSLDANQVRAMLQDACPVGDIVTDDEADVVCALCSDLDSPASAQLQNRRSLALFSSASAPAASSASASEAEPSGGASSSTARPYTSEAAASPPLRSLRRERLPQAMQVWEDYLPSRRSCRDALRKYDLNETGLLEREELRQFLADRFSPSTSSVGGLPAVREDEPSSPTATVSDEAVDFVLLNTDFRRRGGVAAMELVVAVEEWDLFWEQGSKRRHQQPPRCALM